VTEALATDPRIEADGIVVEVFDGAMTLNGTVPSQAQRSEAAAAARRVAGATTVQNLLAVALPSND
jgi:osmotically-inducible protein OsmY